MSLEQDLIEIGLTGKLSGQHLTRTIRKGIALGAASTGEAAGFATQAWVAANYEPAFAKNNGFNNSYGTTAGTVAQGNDSRIVNGQLAYNFTSTFAISNYYGSLDARYVLKSGSYANPTWLTSLAFSKITGTSHLAVKNADNNFSAAQTIVNKLTLSVANDGIGIQDPADLSGWALFRVLSGGGSLIGVKGDRGFKISSYTSDTIGSGYQGDIADFQWAAGITLNRNTLVNGTVSTSAHGSSANWYSAYIFSSTFAISNYYGTLDARYSLIGHNHDGVYEPVFAKNDGFNNSYGSTAGTVAQGNDSRIVNGQLAYNFTSTFAISNYYGTLDARYSLIGHNHDGVYEPVFAKNDGFNNSYGSTAGTVAQGNDSRIVNGQLAYNFTSAFAISNYYGTLDARYSLIGHNHDGVYEPVFAKNDGFNNSYGSTAGTVAQGNDSRIVNGQLAYDFTSAFAISDYYGTLDARYSLTGHNHDSRYPQLTGSYSNPTWITSFAFSKITGTSHLAEKNADNNFSTPQTVLGRFTVSVANDGIAIQDPADLSGWALLRVVSGGSALLGVRGDHGFRISSYTSDTIGSGYQGDIADFQWAAGITLNRNTLVNGTVSTSAHGTSANWKSAYDFTSAFAISNYYGTLDARYSLIGHNHNATYVALAGSYANPTWITSLAASKLTGANSLPDSVLSANVAFTNIAETFDVSLSSKLFKTKTTKFYDTSGSSQAIDYAESNLIWIDVNANMTFTFSNMPTNGEFNLVLQNGSAGSKTLTWPAGVIWPNGSAPVLPTDEGKGLIISFLVMNGNIFGTYVKDYTINYSIPT